MWNFRDKTTRANTSLHSLSVTAVIKRLIPWKTLNGTLVTPQVDSASLTLTEHYELHQMRVYCRATTLSDVLGVFSFKSTLYELLFFLSYLFKRLPGDLSMAWWRFMGSTVVVMVTIPSPFSPSASSRLLCVRASPVSCTQTSNFLFFPNLTQESTFRVIRHLYRNQDSTCSLSVINTGQCWLENDALKLKNNW